MPQFLDAPRYPLPSYSSPCRAPRHHVDGNFDRMKRQVVERCLDDWGRNPSILLRLVRKKRTAFRHREQLELPAAAVEEMQIAPMRVPEVLSFFDPSYACSAELCDSQVRFYTNPEWIQVVFVPCYVIQLPCQFIYF